MSSQNIAQNLRDNNSNWRAVKQAIEDMGVSTTGLTTGEFDDAIRQITGTPHLETLNVTPSTSAQTKTPSQGYDGFDVVNVAAVTAAIDEHITPENIKNNVNILGVTGEYTGEAPNLESKSLTPNFSSGDVKVEPSSGYVGMSEVTLNKDSALIPANVRSGVSIFGINGSLVPGGTYQSKTVNSALSQQVITPDSGYDAMSQVTINPYTLESKTVNSSTSQQTITPSTANGLSQVVINPYTLESKTVTPSASQQTITPSTADGLSQVVVEGDADLISSNIKDGVTIFGVTGSLVEGGTNIYASATILGNEPANKFEEIMFEYNGKLYVSDNRNLYEYDETNDSWSLSYTASDDIIPNIATAAYKSCVVGKKVYSMNTNMSGFWYLNVFDLVTKTKAQLLYNPTGISNACKAMCSDGTNIYVSDNTNTTIWKIPINDHSNFTALATGLSYVPTSMVYRDGYIYGVRGDYVIKISTSTGAVTLLFNLSTSTNEDVYASLVADSDYIYMIGGNGHTKKIYRFNDSNYEEFTVAQDYRQSIPCIYKGKLYDIQYNNYWRNRPIRVIGDSFNKNFIIDLPTSGSEINTDGIKKLTIV